MTNERFDMAIGKTVASAPMSDLGHFATYLPREAIKRLRIRALEERAPVQSLVLEALELLEQKRPVSK